MLDRLGRLLVGYCTGEPISENHLSESWNPHENMKGNELTIYKLPEKKQAVKDSLLLSIVSARHGLKFKSDTHPLPKYIIYTHT